MKKLIVILGLLLILGCQTTVEGPKGEIDWITDLPDAKEMAKTQGKPIIIDFYADWCSWCRKMDKDTYQNVQVAELAKKFVCLKIDTDEQPDVAEKYRIKGLPTTMFLTSEFEIIDTKPGYLPPDVFLQEMENILKAN